MSKASQQTTTQRSKSTVPPLPVVTGGLLMASSLVLVAIARIFGGPADLALAAAIPNPVIEPARDTRDLRFEDRQDGSIAIFDAATNAPVTNVNAGTGGFLRQTLRGLAHDRLRRGGTANDPFRLSLWDDGRVRLQDLATGRIVALEAFGHTNSQSFANLVTAKGTKP